MSEVKWIKLYTDIFDNRKIKMIEHLPEGDSLIVIWLKLLCLAGTINESGLVFLTKEIPYTEQMLADYFGRPLSTIQLALRTFESFGMIDVVDNLLCVSNWEKYQNVDGMEKIRQQTRERVARHRENKKLFLECNVTRNATVTECNATDIEEDKEKEIDKDKRVEKKNNKKEKVTYVPDSFLNDTILDFIENRKKLKKPMTERAIDLMIKHLFEMSADADEQIAILNQSIESGWTNIYPLKKEKNNNNNNRSQQQNAIDMWASITGGN